MRTPDAREMRARRADLIALKLLLDSALALAVLVLLSLSLTGVAVHEWLGIALIGPLLVHLVLNWAWIVATARRLAGALPPLVRINALLNLALFITTTIAIASGLMISVVALPYFGLRVLPTLFLHLVHLVSADMLLIVVGLHLGLNWKWVSAAIRKQIVAPLRGLSGRIAIASAAVAARTNRT